MSLGVGILGSGRSAEYHAFALSSVPFLSLEAVYDPSLDKAKDFARRHHAPRYYDDEEYILQDENIEMLVVATPTPLHRKEVEYIASYGKSIILESPIAMEKEEAKEIMERVEKEGIYLFPVSPLFSSIPKAIEDCEHYRMRVSLPSPTDRWKREWGTLYPFYSSEEALLHAAIDCLSLIGKEEVISVRKGEGLIEVELTKGSLTIENGNSAFFLESDVTTLSVTDFSYLSYLTRWYSWAMEALEKGTWSEEYLLSSIHSVSLEEAIRGKIREMI